MSKYYTETKAAGKSTNPNRSTDVQERGMAVINDVIDCCKDSYLAAKDYHIKIMKEFSDKGLIVLVCQHNCVLWFINMGPNGEKQYFMLAMMQWLLRELPESFTWQLLPHCLLHLKFATPIFHLYGHQWLCQLSYHPYKNPEFGHTDGEGCEREWNLLNGVIPMCRISGFYRRLFVINTKQAYINGQNLRKLASCQKWHFDDVVAKLDEAEGALDRLGIPIDKIQTAWAKQLSTQQAEPPHVLNLFLQINLLTSGNLVPKKDAGMKTIKSILNLLWTYQLRSSLEQVESQLAKKEYNLLLHDYHSHILDAWDDAPRGAIHPEKLDQKGLFSLDVDGAIWKGLHILEAGLGDNCVPPRWLADENMQVAIIAYLDWKGCHAELNIIKCEVANMHVWYAEEHNAIQTVIHEAGTDSALHFHLLHKFTDLNNLGELWDHSLS
ncbi:hypothetical protein BS47DRAFT_1366226 [Hydnum rufescens UP504]|uniref:Uncharacterized protein n=1 Tax=Hydnum rufescens UP504 TaxID=1448309 RepID=A0A9P6ANJ4_9AGAM|nr:hypothetical protein BS47DRAFT_1366226 [Hydnum rufescens UP504]